MWYFRRKYNGLIVLGNMMYSQDEQSFYDLSKAPVSMTPMQEKLMTTSGYRVYDAATLVPESVTKLPGKAKFIDVNGNTMVTAYLATAAQNADEAIKANIQTYATSDYKLSNPITEITNAADIQPNNGKNVVLVDGSKLYLCTGRDGLKVFENGILS